MKRTDSTNRKKKQHVKDKDATAITRKPIKWTYGRSSQVKTEQSQLSQKVSQRSQAMKIKS